MKAIVLLSGGLDSTTVLAHAGAKSYDLYTLTIQYGQRHQFELKAAQTIADAFQVQQHLVLPLPLDQLGGSALTDHSIPVPSKPDTDSIPVTYVPARNTIFLSLALAWAEVIGAYDIFIGANDVDYSGYPDCRPEFFQQFSTLAKYATRAGSEGKTFTIQTPLIGLNKAEIIQMGTQLGVDYTLTVSCYQADSEGRACGNCDACHFRKQGFHDAQIPDPTRYQK